MKMLRLPATFMRGGTSNAVVFRQEDLPDDRALWPQIFLAAIGSPDPNGRQLDGMGGGISSLSKVCVIGPPSRPDADVDYTFAQIFVKEAGVDFSGNCGNMSSAVGPFAVDEGLVPASGDEAVVRIHNTNTNTNKIIVSRFPLDDGLAAVDGDFVLPGVAGTGAPVRLEFLDPGGSKTGELLPTGNPVDMLDVPGLGRIEASLVDAANPGVFVRAEDLGRNGTEMPGELDTDHALLAKLEAIRCQGSIRMGLAGTVAEAQAIASVPRVGFVAAPCAADTLSGDRLSAEDMDFIVRMISVGQPHRATPLTAAMCLAVAARIEGGIVHQVARAPRAPDRDIRIAHPSGITTVSAEVRRAQDQWFAESVVVYRTARRLMDGWVYVRASMVPALADEGIKVGATAA
jgi:2-methylaconitate cis-trans-isomerase PrpF